MANGKVSKTLVVLRQLDQRVSRLETGLDQANDRIERSNEAMVTGFGQVNAALVRLSTETLEVANAVREVRDVLVERLDVRDQVASLDRRVTELERKAG